MPLFIYKARSKPTEILEGRIEAESKESAISQLLEKGITPIKIELTSSSDLKDKSSEVRRFFGKVKTSEVDIFTRQLASLIRSNITLLKALHIIKEQTENPHFRELISQIATDVENGEMLSDVLAKYPKLFPSIYVNMVKAGEKGGILDEALERLVKFREKEEDVRAKIKSAFAYPIFLTIVGILTIFILFTFFMPRLINLFNQLGQILPLPTKILINISNFANHNWLWICIGFFVLVLLSKRKSTSKSEQFAKDWFKLHIPIIGGLIKKAEISKFGRALSILLRSGISIFEAIEITASLLKNEVLKTELNNMRKEIISGSSLSDSMKAASQFSPFVINIITVGEEGGRLEESLLEVANFYEKDVDRAIRLFTSLIEPIIIMIIGIIVGFIVFAMLLPIFSVDMTVR